LVVVVVLAMVNIQVVAWCRGVSTVRVLHNMHGGKSNLMVGSKKCR
jgi:hypothetical protein